MQPWVGIRGTFATAGTWGNTPVIQSEELWLQTDDARELVLEAEILHVTAATLVVETAMGREGPWTEVGSYTAGYTHQTIRLSKEWDATDSLRRFVRWHLDSAAGNWVACFRLNGTMK